VDFKAGRRLWNHGSVGERGGKAPSHSHHADVAMSKRSSRCRFKSKPSSDCSKPKPKMD
jgi:hypothetical protein